MAGLFQQGKELGNYFGNYFGDVAGNYGDALSSLFNPPPVEKSPQPTKGTARFVEEMEGNKNYYYKDELGYWTSGVGHKEKTQDKFKNSKSWVDPDDGVERVVAWDNKTNSPLKVGKYKIKRQYDEDLQEHANAGRDFFGREAFDKLPENVQNVLTGLAFNVGKDGIKKYKRMKEAVENFEEGGVGKISEELMYGEDPNKLSKRFSQTGDRTGKEIMHMINPSPQEDQLANARNFITTASGILPPSPQQPTPRELGLPPQFAMENIGNIDPQRMPPQQQIPLQQLNKQYPLATRQMLEDYHLSGLRADSPQQMPTLQQQAATAQVQPALNPFPWLKEVSGSYSHPAIDKSAMYPEKKKFKSRSMYPQPKNF